MVGVDVLLEGRELNSVPRVLLDASREVPAHDDRLVGRIDRNRQSRAKTIQGGGRGDVRFEIADLVEAVVGLLKVGGRARIEVSADVLVARGIHGNSGDAIERIRVRRGIGRWTGIERYQSGCGQHARGHQSCESGTR